jgi:hypothetical protein
MSAARRQNTIKAEMKMRENVDFSGWRDWFMAFYRDRPLESHNFGDTKAVINERAGASRPYRGSNLHQQWRAAAKQYHRSQSRCPESRPAPSRHIAGDPIQRLPSERNNFTITAAIAPAELKEGVSHKVLCPSLSP